MKHVANSTRAADVVKKEYCDPLFADKAPAGSITASTIGERWSIMTFSTTESYSQYEREIQKKMVSVFKILPVGAVYITSNIDFDPNIAFLWQTWVRLEDFVQLSQKNNPNEVVTLYMWQRTA